MPPALRLEYPRWPAERAELPLLVPKAPDPRPVDERFEVPVDGRVPAAAPPPARFPALGCVPPRLPLPAWPPPRRLLALAPPS
jgi:hypothetical protein